MSYIGELQKGYLVTASGPLIIAANKWINYQNLFDVLIHFSLHKDTITLSCVGGLCYILYYTGFCMQTLIYIYIYICYQLQATNMEFGICYLPFKKQKPLIPNQLKRITNYEILFNTCYHQ